MEKVSELYNSNYGCNERAEAAPDYAQEILVEILKVKAITE